MQFLCITTRKVTIFINNSYFSGITLCQRRRTRTPLEFIAQHSTHCQRIHFLEKITYAIEKLSQNAIEGIVLHYQLILCNS